MSCWRIIPPRSPAAIPPRRRKRWLFYSLAPLLLAIAALVRPAFHLARTAWRDVDSRLPIAAGTLDDASRLNATSVREVWPIPDDAAVAEAQLAELLRQAAANGWPVSIAGARHSMGGHTLAPEGVVIDMTPFHRMSLDRERNLLHVQAGAKWSRILPWLDEQGLSVGVMQSNSSFTVGGSLSVNCHGWQFGCPPIASTVESLRLMRADGEVVRCSRTENPELFSLALGGYGLFGVILDAELRLVPNEQYRLVQKLVPVEEAVQSFDRLTRNGDAAMVYARMGIVPDRFLKDVIINVLCREESAARPLPGLSEPRMVAIRRTLFRGSADSAYGKKLRWSAETKLQPQLQHERFTRNQLLNEGVEIFENRSADHTDILHEYFIPREGLVRFIERVREIVPRHRGDLLNITVRFVDTDDDTFLRYADRPLFSFVMLFHQQRTDDGELRMAAMTGELIDAAHRAGGRHYLPYRLHATREQFQRAYPQAEEFFALKRNYDPLGLFQNRFSLKYATPDQSAPETR